MAEKNYDAHYDTTALLALPRIPEGGVPERALSTWSRPYLINLIRKSGVDVHVSRGYNAFDEAGASVGGVIRPEYSPSGDVSIGHIGDVSANRYGVIRSITKPLNIPTVAQLNPYNLRMMARDKSAVASDILTPNQAYSRSFVRVDSGLEAPDYLAHLPNGLVVAKPIHGLRSRGVSVGSKQEVAEAVREIEVPYILEEKLDFRHPFPSIKGINEHEQARLEVANEQGVNKELRMYYFGDTDWDAVARVAQQGETDFRDDKWLYIDLDSIPTEVQEKSTAIAKTVAQKVGTGEFNIAIDWVYASTEGDPEPRWQVMELNAAEPQLIQLSEHREIGERQHEKLARQIARIARKAVG